MSVQDLCLITIDQLICAIKKLRNISAFVFNESELAARVKFIELTEVKNLIVDDTEIFILYKDFRRKLTCTHLLLTRLNSKLTFAALEPYSV